MTPQERREIVIGTEGNMLSNCSRLPAAQVADYVLCYIDGAANALIRMEGAEAAALFAFGLSDRVAAGLRAPPDFRAPQTIEAPAAPSAEPEPVAPQAPPKWWQIAATRAWRHAYFLGVLHGALILLIIQAMRAS